MMCKRVDQIHKNVFRIRRQCVGITLHDKLACFHRVTYLEYFQEVVLALPRESTHLRGNTSPKKGCPTSSYVHFEIKTIA